MYIIFVYIYIYIYNTIYVYIICKQTICIYIYICIDRSTYFPDAVFSKRKRMERHRLRIQATFCFEVSVFGL